MLGLYRRERRVVLYLSPAGIAARHGGSGVVKHHLNVRFQPRRCGLAFAAAGDNRCYSAEPRHFGAHVNFSGLIMRIAPMAMVAHRRQYAGLRAQQSIVRKK